MADVKMCDSHTEDEVAHIFTPGKMGSIEVRNMSDVTFEYEGSTDRLALDFCKPECLIEWAKRWDGRGLHSA